MSKFEAERGDVVARRMPEPPSILEMATATIGFFGVAAAIGYIISLYD
jgi:hypothetical protein